MDYARMNQVLAQLAGRYGNGGGQFGGAAFRAPYGPGAARPAPVPQAYTGPVGVQGDVPVAPMAHGMPPVPQRMPTQPMATPGQILGGGYNPSGDPAAMRAAMGNPAKGNTFKFK